MSCSGGGMVAVVVWFCGCCGGSDCCGGCTV